MISNLPIQNNQPDIGSSTTGKSTQSFQNRANTNVLPNQFPSNLANFGKPNVVATQNPTANNNPNISSFTPILDQLLLTERSERMITQVQRKR